MLRLQEELALLEKREKGRKWFERRDPNYASRRLMLKAQILDCQFGIQHAQASRVPVGF
jgi:hypothetical protein